MKTNELIDEALDWAVARCEGGVGENQLLGAWYAPSTNWAQGGPIIEREGMSVGMVNEYWQAHLSEFGLWEEGPTPLIAAMRCYVASKLGDDINIPEELL